MFKRLAILCAVLGLALGQPLAFAQDKGPVSPPPPYKPVEIPKPPAPYVKPDKVAPKQAVVDADGGITNLQWALIGGAAAVVIGVAASGHGSSSGTSGTH